MHHSVGGGPEFRTIPSGGGLEFGTIPSGGGPEFGTSKYQYLASKYRYLASKKCLTRGPQQPFRCLDFCVHDIYLQYASLQFGCQCIADSQQIPHKLSPAIVFFISKSEVD